MNIQIFGTTKSFDTKKAQRWFKERNIRVQFIDLKQKGMSKGEFESVAKAVGGWEALFNPDAKDKDAALLIRYSPEEMRPAMLLERPQCIMEPVVRNGRQATVGYHPEVWQSWE